MQNIDPKKEWEKYKEKEIGNIIPGLNKLGFSLDKEQIHAIGERYLMSGKKLVLTGKRNADEKRVIIKTSSEKTGQYEIDREHEYDSAVKKIKFSYKPFLSPEELYYGKINGNTVKITAFIEQNKNFLEHTDKEQFFLAIRAFEMLESTHAAAYSHLRTIKKIFENASAKDYIKSLVSSVEKIKSNCPQNKKTVETINKAAEIMRKNEKTIDLYTGFLTHKDFVPHNFRIYGNNIWLLDNSSLCFGNKHESWARFINYMVIYNFKLRGFLTDYILKNRTPEESLSLRIMRIYKAVFLIKYYSETLGKISGDLLELNQTRIEFWTRVIDELIDNKDADEKDTVLYRKKRDELRSAEEIRRQKEIGQLK